MDERIAGWSAEALADATRARRCARAAELHEFHAAADAGIWCGRGFRSPSAWLAAATGEPVGACKRALHLGDRLTKMPVVARRFAAGDLSEQALGLLADAWAEPIAEAFRRDEDMLVGWAIRLSFPDARTVIATWVAHADPHRIDRGEHENFERRRVHLSGLLEGMSRLDGLLDAEGSRYLAEALRLLSRPAEGELRTPAQRRADALVSMARFVVQHHEIPVGTKRRRPRVVLEVMLEHLMDRTGGTLHGHPISGEAVRRICCDAGLHRHVTVGRSVTVDFGRQTRTISDSLFELLAARDGGCRWAGCEIQPEYCDAHHAREWVDDGGETQPDNLPLLCWYHHHVVHEQHWSIEPLGAGQFELISPTGSRHQLRPPRLATLSC
jgi:hypothetical protein